ncbi:MAG: pteridine reductase, partial [Gammaproteobacteria bacterium]|nr:pteridine reductase [Gammaproteobacteria bacterium]
MTSDKDLSGQWALVTGAAKRIGAAIARGLHAAGANVAIHYMRSADDAQTLVSELNGVRPDSAFAVQADLSDSSSVAPLMETVIAKTRRLDILVNNASSFYPTPLASITEAQWDELIGSNLKAPLFLCQAALPQLTETRGVIVNIVDVHAQRPLKNHPLYGIAKAGLAMLTRSLAKDLGPDIRVNGIAPGAILWPESGMPERIQENIIREIALKRPGEPQDIAAAVVFLVRDAPYVTGQ